jgi:hypothetical protein
MDKRTLEARLTRHYVAAGAPSGWYAYARSYWNGNPEVDIRAGTRRPGCVWQGAVRGR